MTPQSRYRGCLLGLAAGDALGTTLEFKPPGSFTPISDMHGGGPFNLPAGAWTDDTSMALCLAASLIETGSFDPADQMQRYVSWWQKGYLSSTGRCFDIGITVSSALRRFQSNGNPYAGSSDPHSAGNGSLMRLAPVPMRYANASQALEYCADSSRTTHGTAACLDACRYYGGVIIAALNGADKNALLAPWADTPLCPDIAAIAAGSFKSKNPPDIKGTGYVVNSLEAALWAFYRSDDFCDGALMAANLGDDADTTAAIYGQLAGAFYGEAGIPQAWRDKLALGEDICNFADKLFALSTASEEG
jgi:ADP-ribosylglycohydrolase